MRILTFGMKVIRKVFVVFTIFYMYDLLFMIWEWLDIHVIPGTVYDVSTRGFVFSLFLFLSIIVIPVISLIMEYLWKPPMYLLKLFSTSVVTSLLIYVWIFPELRFLPMVILVGILYLLLDFSYHLLGKYAWMVASNNK